MDNKSRESTPNKKESLVEEEENTDDFVQRKQETLGKKTPVGK